MAYCPQCSEPIDAKAAACPHCGYQWPAALSSDLQPGWEYSRIASVALIVASITSGLACLITIFYFIVAFFQLHWFYAFVLIPFIFLNQLGSLVLFTRESKRSAPRQDWR